MLSNPDGTPLSLYHGTNFKFNKFESWRLGTSCRNPSTHFGFYFTDSIDDAWSWAERGSKRFGIPNSPRIIVAHLLLDKVLDLTYAKFNFYLQRAKVSTMQRDKEKWISEGYDGFTLMRDGRRWYLPFNDAEIAIVGVIDREQLQLAKNSNEDAPMSPRMQSMRP